MTSIFKYLDNMAINQFEITFISPNKMIISGRFFIISMMTPFCQIILPKKNNF